MKAKDAMTSPVISVEPDASIWQAVRIMLQRRISGLPVIDKQGRLVGMVSEGDFLRRAETGTQRRRPHWLEFLMGPGRLADEYIRSHGRKIQDIMTPDPVTVTEETPLDEVVHTMEQRRIKRLPVVRGNEVVGIVSRANLLHALAGLARELVPTPMKPFALSYWPSWQRSGGRPSLSSTSSCAMACSNCGARSPKNVSGRRSSRPQKTCPA